MNLSTKPSKASIPCTEDDSAIPLNLCVKEGSNTSNGNNNGSSSSASRLDPSFYSNKINNPQPYNLVKNLPTSSHSNRVQNNIPSFNPFQALSQQQYLQQAQLLPPPQLQSQLQTLSQLQAQVPAQPQQKKRGRKPKSILNSEQIAGNDVPMNLLAAAANIANQQLPRKRGRPPTLSPPHNTLMHNLSSGKPAVSSNNTPSAFPNNYQLNCLLNPEFLNLALAAAANPLFNNCQNPFMLNKINQKDLLNASLLNWKNSLAEQANNKLPINKFPDPGSSIPKDNAQTLLQPFTSKSIEPSIFNKNSFAHKPTPNEKQLRIPLNHGFKRFTYISGFSKNGTVEGSTIYIAPCGKKIKNYSDLIKYLTKNDLASMTRDNFNFDPNIIIGLFIRHAQHLGTEITLSESQMKLQLEEMSKIRNLDLSSSITVQPAPTIKNNTMTEKKKRVRDSGGTRNVYESIKNYKTKTTNQNEQNNKNNDLQPSVTITIQNSPSTSSSSTSSMPAPVRGAKRKSTEKHETAKSEKLSKKQQDEKEKEKEKEAPPVPEVKVDELTNEEKIELEKERLKQHQVFIHMMFKTKLEEDRQTQKEMIAQEKKTLQERQLLKKVLEMELLNELKKPTEDMMLKDHKNLPIFNRIPGLKLTGKAFADMLMVFEFLSNFGPTISITTKISLNSLMMGLLNLDPASEELLVDIVGRLVLAVINDPGVPNGLNISTGQKLKDISLNVENITEILRWCFLAFSKSLRDEEKEDRIEYQISTRLEQGIPFLAMNAVHKLDIMVFLCNELLCNQKIVKQIEEGIESVSTLKKDKWAIENDIRKFRMVKLKRERIKEEENAKLQLEKKDANNTIGSENGDNNTTNNTTANTTLENTTTNNTTAEISDNEEISINTSTFNNTVLSNMSDATDDVNLTNDELDKKIERLNKQCNAINNKMQRALNSFRVFPLGQDRYRRTYWVLPNCGGVFVEGMESGEPEEMANNVWTEEELEFENSLRCDLEEVKNVDMEQDELTEQSNEEKISENEKINEEDEANKNSNDTNTDNNDTSTDDIKEDAGENIAKDENVNLDAKEKESNENSENKETKEENDEKPMEEINIDNIRWFDLDWSTSCEQDNEIREIYMKPPVIEIAENDGKDIAEDGNENLNEQINDLEKSLATFLDKETLDCLFKSTDKCIETSLFKDTLLRILSAFPRSASTTSFPNSDVLEMDITVCQNLQKRIQLWKVLQYETPKKIPREFQLGWWRITDCAQLKSLVDLLHLNAHRERDLQKYITKHLNYAIQSCRNTTANLDVNDYDRDVSETREFGAPTENRCPHRICQTNGFCLETALRMDLKVLRKAEQIEEQIYQNGMHIRSWKLPNKLLSTEFQAKLDKLNKTKFSRDKSKKRSKNSDTGDNSNDSTTENAVIQANNGHGFDNIVEVLKNKVLDIEPIIQRYYLNPPLGFKNIQLALDNGDDNGDDDEYNDNCAENAPTGLVRWRTGVGNAKSSSEISVFLNFLDTCIGWLKTRTVKGVCVVCEKKGKMFLCDSCNQPFHASCGNAISLVYQQGKCFNCSNRLVSNTRTANNNTSTRSGKKSTSAAPISIADDKTGDSTKTSNNKECSKRISNGGSSKEKTEKSESEKVKKDKGKSKKKKRKEKEKEKDKSKEKEKSKEKDKGRKEKDKPEILVTIKRSENDQFSSNINNFNTANNNNAMPTEQTSTNENDIEVCRELNQQIMNHETSWPFMEPVNTKYFPTYKKVIKKPIDLRIIQAKFQNKNYKTKEQYAADIRLMFDNCVTFNEDNSPVGQAGHELRAFFENKWHELFDTVI